MLFHEAVEQRFVRRLSDLLQGDRTDLSERAGKRRHVDQHRLWPFASDQWIGRSITDLR